MNYNEIEELVAASKAGNKQAKETIAMEFRPFILNLSKKTHIISYEFSDIENECYRTLFKCINYYNQQNHRFVAYATNAIKNSVTSLIRSSARSAISECSIPLTLGITLKAVTPLNLESIDDTIFNRLTKTKLQAALNNLDYLERELLSFVYFNDYSLKKYSVYKGITYSSALSRKNQVLAKLKVALLSKKHSTIKIRKSI